MNDNKYVVSSFVKVDQIFSYIARNRRVSFIQMYNDLDIPKASLYRLLYTMVKYEYLTQHSDGSYELGIRLFELGNKMSDNIDVGRIALPILDELASNNFANALMSVRNNRNQAIMLIKASHASIDIGQTKVGDNVHLYCRASGKAILAWLPDEERESVIDNLDLKRYTENTITDREQLREEMLRTRRRGYAVDQQEYRRSLIGFGVPIFDAKNELIGAISLGLDNVGLDDYSHYIAQLQEAGNRIMGRLGRN